MNSLKKFSTPAKTTMNRRFAECQYSELVLSSPSFLKEWLYDYTDDDTITVIIDESEYVYDRYAYNNILYINEEILNLW